jgi:nitrogen fixation NifU-like protein
MGDSFESFMEELERQIHQEMKEAYGEAVYERWLHAPHLGTLPDPDGFARVRGPCGDAMEIFLKFENDRVSQATYRTDGCGATVACGSLAVEMALGKSADDLVEITGDALLMALGSLPEAERHCAYLAAETLQEALNNYMIKSLGGHTRGGERDSATV